MRPARMSDVEILTEFNLRLASETESLQLTPETVRAGVAAGLQRAPEVLYFVAELDGTVIGQLMLTREWSDWRNGWIAWLQSVYVAAQHRQLGVFRCLFESVRETLAQQPEVVAVRLYVETQNQAALDTYTRLGFKDPGYAVLQHDLRAE